MIINNKFIVLKKIIIVLELLHIGFGIGISLSSNLIVHNLLLYIALFLSFIEQIIGMFYMERYFTNMGREFNNQIEFYLWEKSSLFYIIKTFIFYFKNLIYTLVSIFTIKFFNNLQTVILKIYFIQIICQVLLIGCYSYFKSNFETLEINNTENTIIPIVENISLEIKNIGVIDEECSICLDKNNLEWNILPCEHKFHGNCIIPWIRENSTCPICRQELNIIP